MNIEILNFTTDTQIIINRARVLNPGLKIDSNKPADFKRLLTKLVREKNIILEMTSVQLKSIVPLFTYYDIRSLIPCHWNMNIIWNESNDITFETSSEFNDVESSSLLCLIKKVKSSIKDLDENKKKYFIPLCTHVTLLMNLNFFQIYEFLYRLSNFQISRDDKIHEFQTILMNVLQEKNIVLFNEQLLEVYQVAGRHQND